MIIYGSKMYGVSNITYGHGECENCGQYVRHKSYNGRKWGHLYFIPLIPEGKRSRVLKECPKCNMCSHVEETKLEEVHAGIRSSLNACVESLAAGNDTFMESGSQEPVAAGPFLIHATDLLYCLGIASDIDQLLQQLEAANATFGHSVVRSVYEELRSNAGVAVEALQAAAEADPQSALPPYRLASFHLRSGDEISALEQLQDANEKAGGDVNILLDLAGPLESLERYDELCELLEQCIAMAPALGEDKKFMKYYKKYAKKAAKSASR